jgi:hypothetical protein
MDDLLPVLTANAGSLRELHVSEVDGDGVSSTVEAVVTAAPLLLVLKVEEVTCRWHDAPRMLRVEPPFAPLQMCNSLDVTFNGADSRIGGLDRVGPFAAALSDTTLQPELSRLRIVSADTAQPAVMGALVDAAVARLLDELTFEDCTPPAAAPLARLLAKDWLSTFRIHGTFDRRPLFDAAGAALVADALRVNTTLTKLHLWGARLCGDVLAAQLLLCALVLHPRLRELRISGDEPTTTEDRFALGAALAALIAVDAPALQTLDCSHNALGDAGLAPIMDALPLNRHLRHLEVSRNGMSEAFARERLLPAVRANTTLRILLADSYPAMPGAEEAEELVHRRGRRR